MAVLHRVLVLTTAVAVSCTPFGREDADVGTPPHGGASSGTPGADGGTSGSSNSDASLGTCTTFGAQPTPQWNFVGNASATPNGARLQIVGPGASIETVMKAASPLAKSTVEVTFTLAIGTGTWGAGDMDYVDFIQQFYGTAPSNQASPQTSLAFADGKVELDVWSGPSKFEGATPGFFPMPSTTAPSTMRLTTVWGSSGKVLVTIPPTIDRTRDIPTAGAPQNTLIVAVGGEASGNVPAIEIYVKRVCVLLE